MSTFDRAAVLALLQSESIDHRIITHEPVHSIEEMQALGLLEHGTVAKNLFLRDASGKRHFLVMLGEDKTADLKELKVLIGSSRLSFGSPERLMTHLGLSPGAVGPFGLLNDEAEAVELVLDRDLQHCKTLGVHPNDNEATLYLAPQALFELLAKRGRHPSVLTLPTTYIR